MAFEPILNNSGLIVISGRLRAGSTLYPEASRKVARALNAASGRRPAVVLASLAGFDGSASSLLERQLENGAEIARAVVNFDGPIVVVVLGRFHGGAYVVFSRRLNPNVTVVAIEGSFVSVIGGDAAAGVVFGSEVRRRAETKLLDIGPAPADEDRIRAELRLAEREIVAREFDAVHSVERAAAMGSVDLVIPPSRLRPEVIGLLSAASPGAVTGGSPRAVPEGVPGVADVRRDAGMRSSSP